MDCLCASEQVNKDQSKVGWCGERYPGLNEHSHTTNLPSPWAGASILIPTLLHLCLPSSPEALKVVAASQPGLLLCPLLPCRKKVRNKPRGFPPSFLANLCFGISCLVATRTPPTSPNIPDTDFLSPLQNRRQSWPQPPVCCHHRNAQNAWLCFSSLLHASSLDACLSSLSFFYEM